MTLTWNPRGPRITDGEKSLDLSPQQARLMAMIGARPGEMVPYRSIDRDGPDWSKEAYRRLHDKLIDTFGAEAAKALVRLPNHGLRWDGDRAPEQRAEDRLVRDKLGQPMNMDRAIRGAGPDGYMLVFDGWSAGLRQVMLVRQDGQFYFLSETPQDKWAYVVRQGAGSLTVLVHSKA